MDINSGAVHIVDKLIYDALDHCGGADYDREYVISALSKDYTAEDIADALSDIDELISEDMLFSEDTAEDSFFERKSYAIKAMCLHMAHDCNMDCAYCFGDSGAFSGERCLMSYEVGRKALDFLIEHSGSRVNLEIDFFGGEPLMNFEAVKQLVDYGREREKETGKHLRFTITTNGLLLDEEKSMYIDANMVNAILSLDGRREVNDRLRKTASGRSGTYDIIVPNYRRFSEIRGDRQYYVRGTFTRFNLDFSEDVKHMTELGFKNVSVEPVVAPPDEPYSLRSEDTDAILKEYDKLADMYVKSYMEGRPFDFFHFKVDLDQGPCAVKRVSGCGAGTEYIAVTPEGDIYPCHQFVGNKQFKIGSIFDERLENKLFDDFNRANIYNKKECRECWAKFYCSGGCHANAFHSNGSIMEPYALGCEMERKRLECAIGIQAYLAENNSERQK